MSEEIENYFDWHQRLLRQKVAEVKKREKAKEDDLGHSIGLTPEQFKLGIKEWRERQKTD